MLSIEEFIKLSNLSGITKEDIIGRSRKEKITIAREMYWYCLNIQGLGYRRIAKIEGRCKQTISSGICTIKNLINTNHHLVEPYKDVIKLLVPTANQ
ncbi:MAG: hypothetical protein LBV11_07000 [Bacillus cereus]|nr:hypothetical protein [Bacillus cereus]